MRRDVNVRNKLKRANPFPIVGIGASAGGLEAVTELLRNVPADTGMAFVYVQHLDPKHKSILVDILSRITKLKVEAAKHLLRVQPNRVYVIPPDKEMILSGEVLKLNSRKARPAVNMPIDKFLTSLAKSQKERSIGIILSGNANDGTRGLSAIKEAGGLTFAQDDSAKFPSMPTSAIAEGNVDLVLSPHKIAQELVRISENSWILDEARKDTSGIKFRDDDLIPIIDLLKRFTGTNFRHYKINTVRRRILRRMLLHGTNTLQSYRDYLEKNPAEVTSLFADLLINVTSFFRDPDAADYLKKKILPGIFKNKAPGESIRIWVAACSTGEEAYSIAILATEVMNQLGFSTPVQIFATDLSEQAISKARIGIYSKKDIQNISPERLQHHFIKVESGYRIGKNIRDLCVFAKHNVLTDPPFSKLDLVACCNLMIYLDTVLQKRLFNTFHYSLIQNGYLMLGKAETIGSNKKLFQQQHTRYKVYIRKNNVRERPQLEKTVATPDAEVRKQKYLISKRSSTEISFEKRVEEILLNKYIPASIVINKDLDILHLHGQVGLYLELSAGKASLNLVKIARPELGLELKTLVRKSIKSKLPEKRTGIEAVYENSRYSIDIEAMPILEEDGDSLFLVVFERHPITTFIHGKSQTAKDQVIKKIQQELESTRANMRTMLDEQDARNQEFQSANEEVVSTNEELQSINEELETSKEEIESTNEELLTVNVELQLKNTQLSESYEYADAVLHTVREPLLVLNRDLRVKSANKAFYKTFNLHEDDIEEKLLYDIGEQQWNIPELQHLLGEIILKNTSFDNFEVTTSFRSLGERTMVLNGRRILQSTHQKDMILLTIEDATTKKKAERIIADRNKELEIAVKERTSQLLKINSELQRSNLELSQFNFVASHDLQEPLRKITTFINLLQNHKEEVSTKTGQEYLSKINESSKRMVKLIEGLLDLSSISSPMNSFIPVSINNLITDVLKELKQPIAEKNVRIVMEHTPVHAEVAPAQLFQVFYNLVTNSIKFARENVPLIIRISFRTPLKDELARYPELNPETSYAEIIFKDNGIGFKPEFAEKIFVIFKRLNNSKKYPGSGIGLTISKKIVDNHKGMIYAKSHRNGSSFHVILPLYQAISN